MCLIRLLKKQNFCFNKKCFGMDEIILRHKKIENIFKNIYLNVFESSGYTFYFYT